FTYERCRQTNPETYSAREEIDKRAIWPVRSGGYLRRIENHESLAFLAAFQIGRHVRPEFLFQQHAVMIPGHFEIARNRRHLLFHYRNARQFALAESHLLFNFFLSI